MGSVDTKVGSPKNRGFENGLLPLYKEMSHFDQNIGKNGVHSEPFRIKAWRNGVGHVKVEERQ